MKQSQLFAKTLKQDPKGEESANARLLVRAGFIDKLAAGAYSYLPLGLLTLKKIENIVREEMGALSAREVLLPSLHPKANWERTDRWKHKEMFKVKSRQGKDFGLGWTHEEIIVPLVKKFVHSYKDLPVCVYQIHSKFRDELRAKSGLLRGREFIMKDLYSFHAGENDLDGYYEKVKTAYFRIFKRCGLEKRTFLTLASGGAFSEYSHEFQTITPFGEDEIYLCRKCRLGVNREIIGKEKNKCPQCGNQNLEAEKAIEVGNIFKLKDKFTKPFNFVFKDKSGAEKTAVMGCYGIGITRLMGAIAEVYHDEKGVLWPEETAPFDIHLIALFSAAEKTNEKIRAAAEKIYRDGQKAGIAVLYDDREKAGAGEKFKDADLMGMPARVVVSEKTLEKGGAEVKKRAENGTKIVKTENLPRFFSLVSAKQKK